MTAARLATLLAIAAAALIGAGLAAGSDGWSFAWRDEAALILDIRAPRTAGALLAGACLGLAGAIAQGLFRNPLADPYLLGSAAGAALAVTAVLAASGAAVSYVAAGPLAQLGLAAAAFGGALAGVLASLLLAGGAGRPLTLLLAGVVVGMLAAALSELLTLLVPQALRGRQAFLLGTTAFVGWPGTMLLAAAAAAAMPVALALARVLDALVLGEAAARSLGLRLPPARAGLIAAMALATGAAVAQTGLVAFVGLAAPHLVRRMVAVTHRAMLVLSALAGGVLLLAADVAARSLLAPRELPVGLLTATLGGAYLLLLLRRRASADLPRAIDTGANDRTGAADGARAAAADPPGATTTEPPRGTATEPPGATAAGTAPEPVAPRSGAPAPVLQAHALVVRRGPRVVLDTVSVAFPPGAWTAVVGPNGAGKSTLVATLAGVLDADAGRVLLHGRTAADRPPRERARLAAWLPQQPDTDTGLLARDVIALGRLPHHGLLGGLDARDREAIAAAIREADCAHLADRRLDTLSGGERQRVLIARARAVGAPVLLLDEPTTHLDAPHVRRLAQALRAHARAGGTVVTVLHDLTLALAADRVLVIDGGHVTAQGAAGDPTVHAALRAASGDAIEVRRLDGPDGPRWVALPAA